MKEKNQKREKDAEITMPNFYIIFELPISSLEKRCLILYNVKN